MKKINHVLAIFLSIITLICFVKYKEITILLFLPYIALPFIFKLKDKYTIIYLVFGFIGLFNGFLLHFYKIISWYDTFTHFVWGIVAGILSLFYLDIFKIKCNIIFKILFIIIFCLGLSAFWEVFEFTIDSIIGSDMQRRATGVFDTMKDIIAGLFGSILFAVSYLFKYKISN